jgi:hypothetical protein
VWHCVGEEGDGEGGRIGEEEGRRGELVTVGEALECLSWNGVGVDEVRVDPYPRADRGVSALAIDEMVIFNIVRKRYQ